MRRKPNSITRDLIRIAGDVLLTEKFVQRNVHVFIRPLELEHDFVRIRFCN